jgi:hypothetical protein
MGESGKRLRTVHRVKTTTEGLKRTRRNELARGLIKKFSDLSEAEREQRRAAGRASAAARAARAHAIDVEAPVAHINEVIEPSNGRNYSNLVVTGLGALALGGLFLAGRHRLKLQQAKATAKAATDALRETAPQVLNDMRGGNRATNVLHATANTLRGLARGVGQTGDDLQAAAVRARAAMGMLGEIEAKHGKNFINQPPSVGGAPRGYDMSTAFTGRMQRTTGDVSRPNPLEMEANKLLGMKSSGGTRETWEAPDLFSGGTTGTAGGDSDLAARLKNVATLASRAIGQERGLRLSQGPGKRLASGNVPGHLAPKLNTLAEMADTASNRAKEGVRLGAITLRPLNNKTAAKLGQKPRELNPLHNDTFISPSEHRQNIGFMRRDRLAQQSIDDVFDMEAQNKLTSRHRQLAWSRGQTKLEGMRGTSAIEDFSPVPTRGRGFQLRSQTSFSGVGEDQIGGFRPAMARGRAGALERASDPTFDYGQATTTFISPTKRQKLLFQGALSDPNSPFRRGRYSRS